MAEPSDRMEIANLLGVFYERKGRLMVAEEGSVAQGTQDVSNALESLGGQQVHLLVHHCPPDPPNPDHWGGGSCFWENADGCPAGHHHRPQWIYTMDVVGTLDVNTWLVTDIKGSKHPIRIDWLVGHRSQIVVVSMPDFDRMAEKIRALDPNNLREAKVSDLEARATEIRDYLDEINKLKETL